MKKYKISASILWSEEEIRDMIGKDEPFPTEDEIEEWMQEEMRDGADFEVIEDEE